MKMRRFIVAMVLLSAAAGCSTRGVEEGKVVLSYTRWGDPSELDSTRELMAHFMAEK